MIVKDHRTGGKPVEIWGLDAFTAVAAKRQTIERVKKAEDSAHAVCIRVTKPNLARETPGRHSGRAPLGQDI